MGKEKQTEKEVREAIRREFTIHMGMVIGRQCDRCGRDFNGFKESKVITPLQNKFRMGEGSGFKEAEVVE